MLFKPGFVEFFEHEFDALAAEVGKLAHEVEFEIVDHVENGIVGRAIRRVETVFAPTPDALMESAAVPEHWNADGSPRDGNPLLTPEPAVSGDNPEAPTQ